MSNPLKGKYAKGYQLSVFGADRDSIPPFCFMHDVLAELFRRAYAVGSEASCVLTGEGAQTENNGEICVVTGFREFFISQNARDYMAHLMDVPGYLRTVGGSSSVGFCHFRRMGVPEMNLEDILFHRTFCNGEKLCSLIIDLLSESMACFAMREPDFALYSHHFGVIMPKGHDEVVVPGPAV